MVSFKDGHGFYSPFTSWRGGSVFFLWILFFMKQGSKEISHNFIFFHRKYSHSNLTSKISNLQIYRTTVHHFQLTQIHMEKVPKCVKIIKKSEKHLYWKNLLWFLCVVYSLIVMYYSFYAVMHI
jgi:hypothetical protein